MVSCGIGGLVVAHVGRGWSMREKKRGKKTEKTMRDEMCDMSRVIDAWIDCNSPVVNLQAPSHFIF